MRGLIGRRIGGAGGGAFYGARLVQPGALAGGGLVTFSRAQTAAFSTALNAAGNVVEYAADVPRYNGSAGRLMLEGQRTNQIRNPRGEGAPDNWVITAAPSGLTRTITTGISYKGMTGVRVRYQGTPAASGAVSVAFDANTAIAALPLQVWSGAFLWRVSAGTLAGITNVRAQFGWRDSGGASLGTSSVTLTDGGGDNLFESSATSLAGTAFSQLLFRVDFPAAPLDFTIDFFIPRMDAVPIIGSAILPPVGAPAASTRGQDNVTSAFGTLFPNGVGTVLGSFLLPYAAIGADQVLFDINDGSTNNRIWCRNVAGGNTIVLGRTIGGVNVDATTLGSMTPGTLFRVGLTFDGTTITGNLDGGVNQTVATMPIGLTTQRIGNNSTGTAPTFGEAGYIDSLPYVIPGASLPAAVSAIPS